MMIRRSSSRMGLFLYLLIFGILARVSAYGQTFTCSPCAVSVTGTGTGTVKTATPYPSTLTVSGLSGTVATVTVQLQGLTTNGNTGDSTGNLGVLLEAPGGQFLEILGNVSDASESLSGVTLNISDTASSLMPDQSHPWPSTTGTLTFKPTSFVLGSESNPQNYPAPGPGALSPGTTAMATTHGIGTLDTGADGVFANVSPNGSWMLFLIDNKGSTTDNVSITGWSLTFTLNALVATSTALSTNLNPSFTATPNNSVTLTATVTSSSTPSGGTVAFTDGSTTITGCGSQAINGSGQATCTTTFTSEGNHQLTATYSGSGSFAGSTTPSALNQFVKNHSTINGSGQYCNSGTLTVPGNTNPVPDPSIINVGSDTTGIANAVSTVSIFLNTLNADEANGIRLLLEAPSGQSLEFWGTAGEATAISGNFSISDTASSQLPQNAATISAGSYQPTAYTQGDTFLSGPSPAPQAPSTFSLAAPAGNPSAATLLSTFNGATANGDWKLFASYNGGVGHTLTVGSWCLDITPGAGATTTTTVASSLNPATTTSPVTITATVKSSGTPVSIGTVTFTENGQPVAGASPSGAITVNSNGQASITTSSLGEGDHTIEATYNDTSNTFNTSFGNVVQREDNATGAPTVSSNTYTYCNPGKVTIPGPNNASDIGAGSPNPSNIFVTGAPGTVNKVTVKLNNYLVLDPNLVTSLLVGPLGTTADSLDFFSAAGGSSMSTAATLTFDDAASNLVPQSTTPVTGTFKPTSYGSSDTYTQSLSSFFTLPAGPYQYAAPSGSFGLSLFSNQNPNGTWSVYFNQTAHSSGGDVNNGWCLNLTVNPPDLSITKSHAGNFKQGQSGAQYTLTVTNNGPGASAGTVTVADAIPSGLTATAISGTNWNCTLSPTAPSCTRNDAVAQGSSYDPITVTVDVANNAAASVTNAATISGGGDNTAGNDTASDPTTIVAAADLTITKTHTGNFTQGDTGDTYTITVTNSGPGATDSAVNVQDALPTGLTATAMSGTGWTCNFNTQFCSRSDVLASGASYPAITLTVDVASNAAASVTNSVTVSGGGEINIANDTATDPTTVNPNSIQATIDTVPTGLQVSVDGGASSASPVHATWVIGSSHTIATTSPQAGTTGTQYVFANWSDAGAISHSVTAPSTATTYTATFDTQYQLTTAASPSGGGTVTPASGTFFAASAVVPLAATANAGFTFANWTGNVASSTSASTTVTMSQPQSVTANFTANLAPVFTSGTSTIFTVGTAGSFTVGTSGSPIPSLSESGALPSGVGFHDNGNGTATLSGTPAAGTGGVYNLVFTAQNGTLPNATQNFTLTVNQAPAITSAGSTTFVVGTASSFTVTTTGHPTAAIAETGALPGGVTFVDNGNGTATLSGTPTANGTFNITVTASNGIGSPAPQSFTLTVNSSTQSPAITSANSTTFIVGTAGSFSVTATGAPTPTFTETGALPAGVTLSSAGVLSGVPAANGVYPITITASNGVGSAATQSFTLTVNQAPAFTSANSAAFMVGTAGSFTVAAAGFPAPGIAESGALPSGVGFVDNGNGTGTLSGIAIASGTFNIGFTASNSAGNATQNFTLAVSAKTPTVTALTSSANPSTTGQSVTFSVVVSSGAAGTPTGTVTFMDDTTTLGTSTLDATGTATFATSGLAAGTHSITAAYGGDAVFAASSSAILSQMVTGPADFTLSTQPGSATIQAGQTATFTITASAQNGFSSAITLACTSGAPTLSTCQFSSNPITPVASPATSTLTIMTTAAVAANTGPEQRRHSLPLYALWLMVPAMLLGSAKFGSQHRKKLFSFVIVLMILGGCMFQGACLSARNIGGGNASPGTPAGTYTITVTGTAGATQNVVALTLTVQ